MRVVLLIPTHLISIAKQRVLSITQHYPITAHNEMILKSDPISYLAGHSHKHSHKQPQKSRGGG